MKKFLALLVTVLAAMTISACGAGDDGGGKNNSAQKVSSEVENNGKSNNDTSEKATVYPLTVKDATGLELTFDKAPERIVSTSPSETEILFALGLGDKIYGVSDYDDYPNEALTKPKVGGVTKPNEEAIIAANPDLVIGGISMKDDIVKKFRGLDLPLYKTEPKKIDDILNNIIQIGVITDTQVKAEELVAQMKKDISTVTDAAATLNEKDKKKVYIEFSPGWTVGKGEFMDELITMAGGINIASDMEGWNAINEEKIIQDNPEVILYTAKAVDDKSGKPLEELIKSRNGWGKITAIQDNNLTGIEGGIMSRPGPRITDALKQIAEAIYPDLYKK
ncbi:ABC transporter substrate-binding protein [Neobacillus mesonae]|uniref:ABC transporter substrate-binding protein n=1 Tax=Neobacillus mesonae TaxID=1193713 RepID=UPI00257483AF|nr:ABC transporter substrate-binding protein [Neobacillus mesonae]